MRFSFKYRLLRAQAILLIGGCMLQVGGCSTEIRDALLQGLETTSISLSNVLIQALFEGLADNVTQ